MKLTYRGVTYDYNPPVVEMEPSKIQGKYRGLEWRFRNPKRVPVLQPTLDLKYRGVSYRTGTPAPVAERSHVQPAPVQTTGVSVNDLARSLLVKHHKDVKLRQQTLLGRAFAEVGLNADPSKYWAPIQGKISSANWLSYDRSHVAMS
ncbi:DUF4278 domain-containing protein [Lyngbya confervoides]|uniref:DUF4278 domain-containing protein n=1 Tax=Lyngbya confervoides BDU141951 TaxID=1574623 RepID=A0ABD4T6W4_9CYAN|nr:DUF4278 domain-containing protein [Lyngbya confervoides]MCM1984206.1 DUF4278 domain-containing protein [Lyngbya confervoides BDU141951]